MSGGQDHHPYAIIAGFGLPGRSAAEVFAAQHIPYTVIELNGGVVQRCSLVGIHMVLGDVRNAEVLRQAGIDRATLLALCVPNDAVVLEAVSVARHLNPHVRIIARCMLTSTGLEAMKRGADEVVVAEQAVAREMAKAVTTSRPETIARQPEEECR
jgi:voltage-gated potassium channel Kch